jgi:iron complex outermembrane recepter protein
MQKKIFTTFFILFIGTLISASEINMTGIVKDAQTGNPLPSATIEVVNTGTYLLSNSAGSFSVTVPSGKEVCFKITYMGYKTKKVCHHPDEGKLKVELEPALTSLDQVTVTGTRSERAAEDVPMRINTLNRKHMDRIPAFSADDLLRAIPGVTVRRGASFFGTSGVSLRGMGDEAGRTLVLIDGVPVNKTDGGSVNWNAINPQQTEQIEVLKGPGSSIYGGNAMGGVIHLISATPNQRFGGYVSQSAGNFDTWHTKAGISGRNNDLFWSLDGMYRESDGYITAPADEIDEYSIASFLDEYQVGGRIGYFIAPGHMIEAGGGFYDGKRGTGANFTGYGFENENLAASQGAYNQYTTRNTRVIYRGMLPNNTRVNVTVYGQQENYQRIRENMRNEVISRYDVESVRTDGGLTSSVHFKLGKSHSITTGTDFRHGSVDGHDIYVTSPDQVINRGKMNQFGVFLQDEFALGSSAFSLLASLRYDYSNFYDGEFIVNDPTGETDFLVDFAGNIDDASFSALSPRLSVLFRPENQPYRLYAGVSQGYRPPVLDDMSRTGRISGAMKRANPDLKPEYLQNIEIGGDLFLIENIRFGADLFYSQGTDYHAYIATGDSLFLNNRLRPIRIKDNIGEVSITGAELEVDWAVISDLQLNISYSHIQTEITEFDTFDPGIDDDLVGKELTSQPKNQFYSSAAWTNPVVNIYMAFYYKGRQYINEVNSEEIDSFTYVDLQLWRQIAGGFSASVRIHNLFDQEFTDSRNMIAPGRIISAELKYAF